MQSNSSTPDTSVEYPENAVFAKWRSSPEAEKDAHLSILVKMLETHARAVCQEKLPDLSTEFDSIISSAIWRAVKSADKFEGRSKFGTWFHSIVLNECARKLRWVKVKRAYETSTPETEPVGELSDAGLMLEKFAKMLEASDREMLAYQLEGFSGAEIAILLGLSEGAARVRWLRLKAKLREIASDQ